MRRILILLFLNLFVFVEPCFTQGFTPESNLIFPQEELTRFRIEMNQNSLDSLLNGDFTSNIHDGSLSITILERFSK